ncbi:MAG: ACT domain-containing protein [Desulfuromonadaceae bacterium]|nr:ACT domain-containing protein [Desulfuromonadaceae bacterium]
MHKLVLSVLGKDRPGIVAKVSATLAALGCNIEDCSQTILQTEFAAIFIISNREARPLGEVERSLREELAESGLTARIKPMEENGGNSTTETFLPFVVTTKGPDRLGMIAALSGAMAELCCNINNFRAIVRSGQKREEMITIFEISLPGTVELKTLKERLETVARSFALEVSVQHSAIFEATNKI